MNRQYWIIINDMQRGPMSLEELINTPGFGPATPVWREGLADWTVAARLPETSVIFAHGLRPQPFMGASGGMSAAGDRPMPPNYLVWAVLATLCCCVPTGVVALIYSSKVSYFYNKGDYEGACSASEKACWLVIISFVAGLIWAPFSVLWSLLTM